MGPQLEVIVTSVEDSVEAEAGGADRLELVTALEQAGLTPPLALVEQVLKSVRIPVRVMLRDRPVMSIGSGAELMALQQSAAQFSQLPIDGLVLGLVRDGAIDLSNMREICAAAPGIPVTFHRAFDTLADHSRALAALRQLPNVDRLLTRGAGISWRDRLATARAWQQAIAPGITILFAAGAEAASVAGSELHRAGLEIHVGRAARSPQTVTARVSRVQVAFLKRALNA